MSPQTEAGLAGVRVLIDGPHSAPSSTVFSSEHAVLVATGIGVTPFASILSSVVERVRTGQSLDLLRRLDFIWVNREYRSLQWFLLLLRDLETSVNTNFLTVLLFVTSGPSTTNEDTLTLAIALNLLYKVNKPLTKEDRQGRQSKSKLNISRNPAETP